MYYQNDSQQLIYGLTHDLAAPLRGISNFAMLISRKYGDQLDEKGKRWLDFLIDDGAKAEQMVKGLVEHAALLYEKGERETLNLNDICQEVIDANKLKIDKQSATVQVNKLPRVVAYKSHWLRIFQALIENSLKYQEADNEPHIYISSSEEKDMLHIVFDDNGIGIPENRWDDVTSIFRRLHAETEYPGIGMGLADCQRVLEMNEGSIKFADSPLGGLRVICSIKQQQ